VIANLSATAISILLAPGTAVFGDPIDAFRVRIHSLRIINSEHLMPKFVFDK
jgi:hypothetical protein